jgi:hypothetical protein
MQKVTGGNLVLLLRIRFVVELSLRYFVSVIKNTV